MLARERPDKSLEVRVTGHPNKMLSMVKTGCDSFQNKAVSDTGICDFFFHIVFFFVCLFDY